MADPELIRHLTVMSEALGNSGSSCGFQLF